MTVLIVDDEENVLKALTRALYEEPYTVIQARSGGEALAIIDSREVDLVVTDVRMPGMDGMDLLGRIQTRHPELLGVVLTSYADPQVLLRSINELKVFRFITKPWETEKLKSAIRLALEQVKIVRDRNSQQQARRGVMPNVADLLSQEEVSALLSFWVSDSSGTMD